MSKMSNYHVHLQEAADELIPFDNEYLDNIFFTAMKSKYGQVSICGQEMDAITALAKIDPDAHDVMFENWLSNQDDLLHINSGYYDKFELEAVARKLMTPLDFSGVTNEDR